MANPMVLQNENTGTIHALRTQDGYRAHCGNGYRLNSANYKRKRLNTARARPDARLCVSLACVGRL